MSPDGKEIRTAVVAIEPPGGELIRDAWLAEQIGRDVYRLDADRLPEKGAAGVAAAV